MNKNKEVLDVLNYGDDVYPNEITTLLIYAIKKGCLSSKDIEEALNGDDGAYSKISNFFIHNDYFVPDRILRGFREYYRDVECKMHEEKDRKISATAKEIYDLRHTFAPMAFAG